MLWKDSINNMEYATTHLDKGISILKQLVHDQDINKLLERFA